MSRETQKWLEENIRVGFTEDRGHAWWYQNDTSSHYPHAVPEKEARRILDVPVGMFPVYVDTTNGENADNEFGDLRVPGRYAVMHTGTKEVFYLGTDQYEIHPYVETLIDGTELIADEKLAIGSVGILMGGARAFVQYEAPETLTVGDSGERYRPFLVATSSLDGQSGTQWKYGVTRVVCDNTLDAFMGEAARKYTMMHKGQRGGGSKGLDVLKAREALDMLTVVSEDFEAEVKRLLDTDVSDSQWSKFLEAYAPINPEDDKLIAEAGTEKVTGLQGAKSRVTRAENIREDFNKLYKHDVRIAPWSGTAWGVLQTANTWNQHYRTTKGDTSRYERNMMNFFDGKSGQDDQKTRKIMEAVGILRSASEERMQMVAIPA